MAMISLWMSPWLKHIDHFNIKEISMILSVTAVGSILGPIFIGWLGNLFSIKGKSLFSLIILGNALFALIQVIILSNKWLDNFLLSTVVWFLFFIFAQSATLGFSVVVGLFENRFIGRAITMLNMLFFLSAFLCQNLYDLLENLFQNRFSLNASCKMSFSVFVLTQIIIIAIYFLFSHSRRKRLKSNVLYK